MLVERMATEGTRVIQQHGATGAVYGLGFLGALVYYIQTATSFWVGVLGVLKAIVWPAFLVYAALARLGG
jgi:hypothetical protein